MPMKCRYCSLDAREDEAVGFVDEKYRPYAFCGRLCLFKWLRLRIHPKMLNTLTAIEREQRQ